MSCKNCRPPPGEKIKRIEIKTEEGASFTHLDDLTALHLHQTLQDLLQVVGVGPPVQQTQQIHWETEQNQSNTSGWEWGGRSLPRYRGLVIMGHDGLVRLGLWSWTGLQRATEDWFWWSYWDTGDYRQYVKLS